MKKKRAAIYCRAATIGQESFHALDAQKEYLKSFAESHYMDICGCYSDVQSGLTRSRPGLTEPTKAIENGEVDNLLVADLSRLWRRADLLIRYRQFLQKHSVGIYTLKEDRVDLNLYLVLMEALQGQY